jgi:phage/plasmid-associated DNA primase
MDQYLRKFACNDDANILDLFGGKYRIPDDSYDEFLLEYSKHATDKHNGLVERRASSTFPMIFDIDFPDDFAQDRIEILHKILDTFHDYIIEPWLNAMERPDSRETAKRLVYKDAKISHRLKKKFHVVFRSVLTTQDMAPKMISHLQDVLSVDCPSIDWKRVLDASVVTSNGLRMLGSYKPIKGTRRPDLKAGYYVPCTINWTTHEITDGIIDKTALEEHSVYKISQDDQAIYFSTNELSDESEPAAEDTNRLHSRVIVPLDVLQKAIMSLPDKYYDSGSYQEWSRIVWTIQALANDGNYVDEGLELAHDFSRQAGLSNYDSNAVDELYQSGARRLHGPRLGWRSLLRKLQEHAPDVATELTSKVIVQPLNSVPDDWDDTQLGNVIREMLNIDENTQITFVFSENAICFTTQDQRSGKIRREDGAVTFEDNYVGHVTKDVEIDNSLALLHSSIPESARWKLNFTSQDEAELRNQDGNLQGLVVVHNHLSAGTYLTLTVGGLRRGAAIRVRDTVRTVQQSIIDCVGNQMLSSFGISQAYFDRCVFNIVLPEGEKCRPEGVLAKLLIHDRPNMAANWIFDSDCKSQCRNGLFRCHPETRVWGRVNNAVVENDLRSEFATLPGLTVNERSWMWTRRGISAIREEFAALVLRQGFEDELDTNLDIFPLEGGICYDTTTSTFRRMQASDKIHLTVGWNYDETLARKHREDVERFFEELFPIVEEREIVLRFLSGILSGRRYVKKMLCLTDRRAGNNGKSTVVKLLQHIVGDLCIGDNSLLLQGSIQRGRNDHDAGLEPWKGYRLALSEELKKSQKLDEGTIKNLTGGESVICSGRCIGKGDRYKFTWSSLIIAVFNEGDLPQFDLNDQAFVGRLLIAPMRSKFIPGYEPGDDDESYTYRADARLPSKMLDWRSAVFDILRERYVAEDISNNEIPMSMKEWRADIVNDRNEVGNWLNENVEKSDDKTYDVLTIKEIFEKYKVECLQQGEQAVKPKDFKSMATVWFAGKGLILMTNSTPIKIRDGTEIKKINFIRGVRWCDKSP